MLLFKSKPKEILPPPPPSSEPAEPEHEEEPTEEFTVKPKFFDEVLEPDELKTETFPEEEGFKGLVEELEEPKLKKPAKKGKTSAIPKKPAKAIKLKQKPAKIIQAKQQVKAKKPQFKKAKEKKPKPKALKEPKPKIKEAGEFEVPEFELPKELEPSGKDIEMPENLDEFGIDLGRETEQESKPKEVIEAQEEIKSAIDSIKKREKPSFLKRLFARKEKAGEKARQKEEKQPAIREDDSISGIQDNISKARDALAKFDLQAAKKNYVEAMRIYNSLNPEEQAKYYPGIKELYYERKSAEELKV